VINLYDMTGGNYRVRRTVTYPDFANSRLDFEAEVRAVKDDEWSTDIAIGGTYDGPTDVVAVKDYTVLWSSDGKTLFEEGSADLVLASGGIVRSKWTSDILPTRQDLRDFPKEGERVMVSYSAFAIRGNTMSYEWEGTVEAGHK
jgi:hypothetical protein